MKKTSRRNFIKDSTLLAGAAVLLSSSTIDVFAHTKPPKNKSVLTDPNSDGHFVVPQLGMEYSALEPYIDSQTMEIHHSKHHAAYVNNLNKLIDEHAQLKGLALENILGSLDTLPENIRTSVRNNAGGHWNHSFFWESLSQPNTPQSISKELLNQIELSFKTIENFKNLFEKTALSVFGSGWAWLVQKDNRLEIISTPNQDNPLMHEKYPDAGYPILGLDVWEHAYYLKYQNKRADYCKAFWNVVNWNKVASRLSK